MLPQMNGFFSKPTELKVSSFLLFYHFPPLNGASAFLHFKFFLHFSCALGLDQATRVQCFDKISAGKAKLIGSLRCYKLQVTRFPVWDRPCMDGRRTSLSSSSSAKEDNFDEFRMGDLDLTVRLRFVLQMLTTGSWTLRWLDSWTMDHGGDASARPPSVSAKAWQLVISFVRGHLFFFFSRSPWLGLGHFQVVATVG